jgi:hypothetical protein
VLSGRAFDVPTSKATLPAAWESKLLETINGLHKSVTEQQDNFLRLLQGDEDVDLEDICQEILLSSTGIGCSCTGLNTGHVSLNCPDSSCLWCDEDLERCGMMNYTWKLGWNGTPPDYIVGKTTSFEYTTGETVAVSQATCDGFQGFPSSCSECVAYVNGEVCTSCAMCEDGFSVTVDCENLATNSSFSECLMSDPEYGIFNGLHFSTCQPTNDVCTNSTLLEFEKAMIGRTNGATEDSISSSCSLAEGKDVWYTVVGTGDTIMATTCSYATLGSTIMDVIKGSESCKDLECIAATNFSCADRYNGVAVTWPSEAGVSYHLRVVTVDYEDQFEIVVWDVPSSENTACTTSVASTSIDAIGSTLALSDQLETDTCDEIGTPGLWYQVTALEDGVMRASTCSKKTSIDTAISVLTGDCDTYTCLKSANTFEGTIGCTQSGTILEWNVTSNQTYFVYIRGVGSNGIFAVSIELLQVPVNDACAAAASISIEDDIIQGNIDNATEDIIVGASCTKEAYITPRGVWYKISGNAKFLRATACSSSYSYIDVAISVYTGDCSDLVCAAESFYTNCGSSGGSTVSWEALEGVEYYLFVYAQSVSGSFNLLVEEFEPAPNIQCINAEGPLTNQTIVASTLISVSDGISECSSGLSKSAGLWYWVLGKEGLMYRVDTCSENTNFDTEISIYKGSCDGELECVDVNDESCDGTTSSVQWKTEEGVMYYIKIHGFDGAIGNFGMTVARFVPPKNDDCLESIHLSHSNGETVVVSTAGAKTLDVLPGCSRADFDAPSIWYRIEGKGEAISVSSCSPLTKVPTSIFVFSGSCQELVCVSDGFSDDTCQDSVASRATFLAEEGDTYFILIQSPFGYGGDVGLTIMEFEAAEHDFCQRASIVVVDDGEVAGTIVGASGGTPYYGCSSDPSIPDVWYFVAGTGDVLQATACSGNLSFLSMSVLQGKCTEGYCIATGSSDKECATVRFQSVIGETYHILFQASPESSAGMFSLSVTTSTTPENDHCSNAELIDPSDDMPIFGSTADSLQDFLGEVLCWRASTGRDLWYRVVGTGTGMLATLESPETDFDSQLFIYSSSDEDGSCSNLECVAGSANQIWWLTEQDRVYSIRVLGYADSFGNFALTVREQVDELAVSNAGFPSNGSLKLFASSGSVSFVVIAGTLFFWIWRLAQ